MMLYVFHVDVGRMMSFDMTVALSSVENLKDTIERLHGIPAANIVLLVSGGEMLTESTQVSYYSAGTDTNPIYMFLTGDAKLPQIMQQTDTDLDLRAQVERSMELPAVYETVVTRTQLALKMYDHAREEERLCERLVHDQHLQQQGWSAVVANMEDLTEEFRSRFRGFCNFFDRHLEQRARHSELLRNFSADLSKLSRIPILPGLMPLAEADFHGFDEYLDNDEVFSRSNTQQESVLMAGAETENTAPNASTETSNACDTSSSSPHQKPKMDEHEDEKEKEQASLSENSGKTGGQTSTHSGVVRRSTLNLLQWITSKENYDALQTMSNECIQGLSTFNEEVYEKLKTDVQNIIKMAEQTDVKEIKGLGERLCKLEEFKYKIKSMVQEQKEHSTGFQQNQNRAINLRDPSILPDLCESHRSQLSGMLQNHKKILEHRRCIAKAKDELGINLNMRLNRIVCIENAMSDIDSRLLCYHRCLRRAERHISIIEQIHQAPCIYVAAVTEVVRRKIFSEEFRKWASKLSDDFEAIHSEEIERRELFNASFEGHFLNILFPGMNDMPPAFANENPLAFDGHLPNLTKSDIEMLTTYLPDLASQIQLPDMGPVIRFFVSRSGEHQKERWEQLLREQSEGLAISPSGTPVPTEKPQHLRLTELQKAATAVASGGCDESETDTEIEFEKVTAASGTISDISQVQAEGGDKQPELGTLTRSTLTDRLLMTSAETLTDDNGSTMCDEVERLRHLLSALSQHSLECIRVARCNLSTFRTDAAAYRDDLQSDIRELQNTCKIVRVRCEEREEQLLQENRAKDIDLDTFRAQLQSRDAEIERLQNEVLTLSSFKSKYDLLSEQMKEMQAQFAREKETAVALAREELIHEHKTEIESLRCRFKLMTSMERSPSDMSLEKIERPISRGAAAVASTSGASGVSDETTASDMIELKQHEAIRAQLEAEKERAVSAAVEAERIMWQSKMTLNSESVMANVGILKVIEEKDRQLEQLREHELVLSMENLKLKTRLDSLTNEDANNWLKEKIEFLHRDKERLEKELEKLRRQEMEGSFAGPRGLTYEHGALPRSKSSSSSHKHAALQSVERGDVVFAVWSTTYGQYIVVQDSQTLFFVHGDSLPSLKLQLPKHESESPMSSADEVQNIPMPYYTIGIVVEKEYCQARKDENRYRVPRGSKFYRVKLAPVAIAQPTARMPRDRLESCSKSTSRSQSQCESQSEASSTAPASAVVAVAVASSAITAISTSVMQIPVTGNNDVVDATTRRSRSTGSKSEEEEPIQLLGERFRYISVSEEESSVTNTNTTLQQQQQQQQQQSVITEQPTASKKLQLDLMLRTPQEPLVQSENIVQSAVEGPKEHKDTCDQINTIQSVPSAGESGTCAPSHVSATIPTIPTTGEDSDEYRSLEGKENETAFGAFD